MSSSSPPTRKRAFRPAVGDLPVVLKIQEALGQPFEWKFTRQDLAELLAKIGPATPTPKIR